MLIKTIIEALATTKLPVAYGFFRETPEPPFLVYILAYSNNFGADDIVYHPRDRYNVELYTDRKDPETEKTVQDALDDAELFWDKTETFVPDEELYQIIYTIYER